MENTSRELTGNISHPGEKGKGLGRGYVKSQENIPTILVTVFSLKNPP